MPTDIESIRQRHAELSTKNSDFTKATYYKWKPGKNTLRILPGFDPRHCEENPDMTGDTPASARNHFAVEVKKANNVGPNGRTVILDPNKPGPLEDYLDQLNSATDEASQKEAESMRPKNRVKFFVIDRDNELEGPQCLDWNLIEYNKVLAICADPEYLDIACPFNGTDLVIDYVPRDRTANGFAQWPSVLARRTSSRLTDDPDRWNEWLSIDYFDETGATHPTEPDYIQACLEGTDTEFNRQNREAGDHAHSAGPSSNGSAMTTSTYPTSKGEFPVCEHSYSDTDRFWMNSGGQVIEVTAADVAAHVLSGQDPQIMSYDQSSAWDSAANYGFEVVHPTPPPAPPAPPAASAPPAPPAPPAAPPIPPPPTTPPAPPKSLEEKLPFDVPASETQALEQQLAEVSLAGTESVVGQDLRSALSGK